MSNEKTGGPAFPVFPDTAVGHGSAYQGMTMRDWFAGLAMQGMLGQGDERAPQSELNLIVVQAYRMADAMLEARK